MARWCHACIIRQCNTQQCLMPHLRRSLTSEDSQPPNGRDVSYVRRDEMRPERERGSGGLASDWRRRRRHTDKRVAGTHLLNEIAPTHILIRHGRTEHTARLARANPVGPDLYTHKSQFIPQARDQRPVLSSTSTQLNLKPQPQKAQIAHNIYV